MINDYVYIGLSGVNNFGKFWNAMENNFEYSQKIGEVFGMKALLNGKVKAIEMDWNDIGNKESLIKTRKIYENDNFPVILDKEKEKIWFVDNKVIKFHVDKDFITNRVKRANYISSYIPKMLSNSSNMYMYVKQEGEVYQIL